MTSLIYDEEKARAAGTSDELIKYHAQFAKEVNEKMKNAVEKYNEKYGVLNAHEINELNDEYCKLSFELGKWGGTNYGTNHGRYLMDNRGYCAAKEWDKDFFDVCWWKYWSDLHKEYIAYCFKYKIDMDDIRR